MFSEKFVCPPLGTEKLIFLDGGLYNPDSKSVLPLVAGIPWLGSRSHIELTHWQSQIQNFHDQSTQETAALAAMIKSSSNTKAVRRLTKLMEAKRTNASVIEKLLLPIGNDGLSLGISNLSEHALNAMTHDYYSTAGSYLHTYFPLLFRDWAWNTIENDIILSTVKKITQENWPTECFVLGSGAGRLVYDLSFKTHISSIFAFEVNPLLMLTAAEMFAGKSLQLFDFSTAPHTLEDQAVLQTLSAPKPLSESKNKLHLAFSDLREWPIGKHQAESFLTPWFIDVVDLDFNVLCKLINFSLKPGGSWFNFGPLGYGNVISQTSYLKDEILDILKQNGFSIVLEDTVRTPYLISPQSSQERSESIFCFSVKKVSECALPSLPDSLPAWQRDKNLPLPTNSGLRLHEETHRIQAEVLSLIDGQTSVNQILDLMEQHYQLPRAKAAASLDYFLSKIYHRSKI